MIRIALIAALFTCHFSWAQTHKTAKNLRTIQPDSCFLSVYLVATKEMVRSEGQVIEKLLERKEVLIKDIEKLLGETSKKSSYQQERALLTHHNIIIHLYRGGAIYGNLTLSSKTGNIIINNNTNGQRTFGNVSQKFGEYMIQLLNDHDMLELIHTLDLEGFNKNYD